VRAEHDRGLEDSLAHLCKLAQTDLREALLQREANAEVRK
jgi:hypothetical protein